MFTKAIVRAPAANFSEGLTTAGLGAPDYQLALAQHAAYCAALEECGLELIRLEADELYPDSCFVEDTAVIISGEKRAIITRPGAASRRGETAGIRGILSSILPLSDIQSPGTVDGGDICEAGSHFFIGISERTNEDGAQQFAEAVGRDGCRHSFVDIRGTSGLLHLKSGLAHLPSDRLIVTEPLVNLEEFRGYELICVDPGEEYAANCIEVNGRVLIAAGFSRFETKLRDSGYQTIALDMSEFQKMDGGLSCLSLRW